jgi:hypothetical protein
MAMKLAGPFGRLLGPFRPRWSSIHHGRQTHRGSQSSIPLSLSPFFGLPLFLPAGRVFFQIVGDILGALVVQI